jgi:hypothetical protein
MIHATITGLEKDEPADEVAKLTPQTVAVRKPEPRGLATHVGENSPRMMTITSLSSV